MMQRVAWVVSASRPRLEAFCCIAIILSPHLSHGLSNSVTGTGSLAHHSESLPSIDYVPSMRTTAISPLSLTFDELSDALGGSGKAKACWDCLRIGVDPVWFYSNQISTNGNPQEPVNCNVELLHEEIDHSPPLRGWNHQQIQNHIGETSSRRQLNGLGQKTINIFQKEFGGTVEKDVATLSKITTCTDGTTKLLLRLMSDGLEVETVIIPWNDREKSTVCVSSQVGCRQACTFCSTGRMGKLRSLTASEILAQLYWANKICRLRFMFPVDNCVFMGMGEPADNVEAVVRAAQIMVDRNLFQLAPRRVTISTVAPSPHCFSELGQAPVVLAWSVHSSRDVIRKQLVPTTQHTMEHLRDGLITTLQGRSKRLRNIMLEVTLLDQINDSPEEDAIHLAKFCHPLLQNVDGIKLVVNLIPWNDINASFGPASAYRQPKPERVLAFQKVLIENGVLCYVRTTRGDEENAACGMLSTSNNRTKNLDGKNS